MTRTGTALLASGALHLLALAWLSRVSPPPAARAVSPASPVPFEVAEAKPPAAPPPPEPAAAPVPRRPLATRPAPANAAPSRPGSALAAPSPELDAPRRETASQRAGIAGLLPLADARATPDGGLDAPKGRTLRPGDPSLVETRAQEGARVAGRVDRFLRGQLGALAVENGLIDPYFGRLRHALERSFEGAPLFGTVGRPGALQGMVQTWREQLQHYGATGAVPTASALKDAATGGGLGNQLVAIVELHQESTGRVGAALLLQTSGNRAYDAFVLSRAPTAVETLPPPPPRRPGQPPETVTVWAFRGHVSYLRRIKVKDAGPTDLLLLSGTLLLGAPFEETTGEVDLIDWTRPHFDTTATLLSAQ